MEETRYVEVTQDGIGRIIFGAAPRDIQGLYTEDLQTCLALIIVGEKGITLIHTTGRIIDTAIAKEFTLLGKIKYWTIGFNPEFYPKGHEDQELQFKLSLFIDALEKVAPNSHLKNLNGKFKLYPTLERCITVTSNGDVIPNIKRTNLLPLPNKDKRARLNVLNNLFSEDPIAGDLQFDGHAYTEDSFPVMSFAQMAQIGRTNPKYTNEHLGRLKYYLETYEPANVLQDILATESTLVANEIVEEINIQGIVGELNQKHKEETLKNKLIEETLSFFKAPPLAQWKPYPENRLTPQFFGQKILFFNMPGKNVGEAQNFAQHLQMSGLSAKPSGGSVLVNLTLSVKK